MEALDGGLQELVEVNATASTVFTCPAQCLECCSSSTNHFKCVLRSSSVDDWMIEGRDCSPPENRRESGQEAQLKTKCAYTEAEKASQVRKTDAELSEGCSRQSRCCCNADGQHLCVGDRSTSQRFQRTPSSLLPDPLPGPLWFGGYCPAGFSDYTIAGEECRCQEACGVHKDPDLRPRPAPNFRSLPAHMAALASAIYLAESPVSGWRLVKYWDVDKDDKNSMDFAGIYTRKLPGESIYGTGTWECALTFAGTDDFADVKSDLALSTVDFCDGHFTEVHKGFARETMAFMEGERFSEFATYLNDANCGGGIYTVGHSLGGAIAVLVAGCAKVRQLFEVNGVYTFAAPALSKKPLEMPGSLSGCFPGGRFYVEDRYNMDVIPAMAQLAGFKHPFQSQFRIKWTKEKKNQIKKIACGKNDHFMSMINYPRYRAKTAFNGYHDMDSYIRRMMNISETIEA
eukprot:gnl/TRDRNA2_/TRDRNA2_202219_c0_seq1.p1 gnl/TRDRNA2_/TRDRNA2_202219_c0~~gnl/TRDRNA2_/TRDRNA2_202219_c0_seq1.p1  ORF type:complete len:511 (+),score=73.21 gnl/TRDRNA2_/TRDRNA2_202219_c0_seq1:162-1535(+)